ncbi:SDR family oxidoreductase [Microbacterium sp. Sa4CUA7]|uniref:SDR family oxidoreductase n=1 Tax=Microbacterium pullorum TaxID=2762236 RepID=A0ABR8S055_9MICO|nr:SDR family oxidoreductase [Microbacterium pullorum]MBD7956852.1 SDR family oxidoreductase [Microbacterium pullorum]
MVTIDNSVVLVTGANGGLGTEFVRQALSSGASRVYAAARNPREWDDSRVIPLVLDVTDPASIAAAATAAGDVTILVNNAGLYRGQSLIDGPEDELRQSMETNLFGPVAMTRAFAPALRAAESAGVVNVASVISWLPTANSYSVSKAALSSATNVLRLDLAASGVHVLGAYLAYTRTPMTQGMTGQLNEPADVVRDIYEGLSNGADEVLADEISRQVRAGLSAPIADLLAAVSGNAG